jgi:hypothetical protein
MDNPFVVVLLVVLAAALLYALISFGVFGTAGKIGRSKEGADEVRSKQDGT